jgi:hypothetical protein
VAAAAEPVVRLSPGTTSSGAGHRFPGAERSITGRPVDSVTVWVAPTSGYAPKTWRSPP